MRTLLWSEYIVTSSPWSSIHYSYRTCSERDPLGDREEAVVFENERLAWDFARERSVAARKP